MGSPDSSTIQPSPAKNRNNLRASAGDAAAFGAMVGAGETYLPAFALAAGLGEVVAGLVASLPLAVGGWLQLISLRAMQCFRSEKQWILLCATLQGSVFLLLAVVAWQQQITTLGLLGLATIYWACGLASGPAWNTWIGQMVPAAVRPKFFGFRTLASQISTVFGLVVGGWLVSLGGGTVQAFIVPFLFAALMRFFSVALLAMHRVPHRPFGDSHHLSRKSHDDLGRAGQKLILYLVVTQGMVQLAGPYIAPLMLHHLQLSYGWFVALTGVAFAAKAVALRVWPSFVGRHGASWLLRIGGAGLVVIPIMWLVSWHPVWLLFTQACTGFLTAAYELGFMLMFFETLPAARRTRVLTWYNAANTTAWCLGAAVGAWWLWQAGGGSAAYTTLLALSAGGRAAALVLLFGLPTIAAVRVRMTGFRVLSIRPGSASIEAPVSSGVIIEQDARQPEVFTLPVSQSYAHKSAG